MYVPDQANYRYSVKLAHVEMILTLNKYYTSDALADVLAAGVMVNHQMRIAEPLQGVLQNLEALMAWIHYFGLT